MKITIQVIDLDNLQDVNKCDAAFTVNSRLVLNAANGVISYSVASVEPYLKPYIFEEKDYPSYIANPNKIIYFAYIEDQLAGQIDVSKHWNAYAWIGDFFVDVHFRKRGVGHAMMQKAVLYGFDTYLYKGLNPDTDEIALYWYLLL
jgi:streptothricin acetyltransferase